MHIFLRLCQYVSLRSVVSSLFHLKTEPRPKFLLWSTCLPRISTKHSIRTCLSLVFLLRLLTFLTPPPSWTPSPETLTGIGSNPCALRHEDGQFGPLAARHPTTTCKVNGGSRAYGHWSGGTNTGKRTHERINHWMPKRVVTVVVAGTAVATWSVCWCVSGCSETEQSGALWCQSTEQVGWPSEKHGRNGNCHSLWCRDPENLIRNLLRWDVPMWSGCWSHSSPWAFLKIGRYYWRTITSWQSTTIKRVARSTLAAEGQAVCEGLESAQRFRHLVTEAHMARSSRTDVEKDSLKRPALVFTDSDSMANTLKKDVGQSHDNRLESWYVCAEKSSDRWRTFRWLWMPTHLLVADPLAKTMEKDILAAFFNCRTYQSVAKKS